MITDSEKVALLISTYNKPEYLRQTLLSLTRQTRMPDTVVIADDGSDERTKALIDSMREAIPVPLLHIWHPDTGFRLSAIRNKAMAAVEDDYIIQIDGDVVLGRHFVEDHASVAERGYFVLGSRVYFGPKITERILRNGFSPFWLFGSQQGSWTNRIRIGWLRRRLATRYAQKVPRVRGCNMAFWREDIIRINGYNEDFTGWGGEDTELVCRLKNSGVAHKALKAGGVQYHLWHPMASRSRTALNQDLCDRTECERIARAENGIAKYLRHER
ncbi:glycosyltransferase family 2 protein [Rikenella microfusus]|uniref:glycosyltransferase family 2 protein n=1 Tax=Rikenella microfusus TaxID=28139 RepID=UPI001D26DB3E|nr:glycosyltransferase family 2 protein [Rikenella microfusus]HJE88551.1 glycosyltransferase family 2 protein [Rikenella microfusus]